MGNPKRLMCPRSMLIEITIKNKPLFYIGNLFKTQKLKNQNSQNIVKNIPIECWISFPYLSKVSSKSLH